MINYNNGKIYKIEPICEHDECEIYIGSTTKTLNKRFSYHKNDYIQFKNGKSAFTTSYKLFDKYGIENCNIILLEIVNCNSKDELFARESHYIRTLKCVNKITIGRTSKEYRENNKEKIKTYRLENKEKIKEKTKQYYEKNKEKISDKHNLYHQKKRKINLYATVEVKQQYVIKRNIIKRKNTLHLWN